MDNWVKLRHECSPLVMFTKLRLEAEKDVKIRNQVGEDRSAIFKIIKHDGNFSIAREGHEYDVRDFIRTESGIMVKDKDETVVLEATLTLTDEAECRLKLKSGEELTTWQFRKRALEDLFFNFS